MKRWIIWLLILMLALSGCNTDEPNSTTLGTEPVDTTQQPTVPSICLYDGDSRLEKQTEGAVKVYMPEGGEITGIGFLSADIVVFTYDETQTTLMRFSGEDGMMKALSRRNGRIGTGAAIGNEKIVFYDAALNSCVMLDGTFHEMEQVKLPDIIGNPVLSADQKTAFYYTGAEIRAMNLQTGIARLVCQTNAQAIELRGLLFNDTILSCNVVDADGNHYAAFYSSETGVKQGSDANLLYIADSDENYLVRRIDGPVEEVLIGSKDGSLRSFANENPENRLHLLPNSNELVQIGVEADGVSLSVYELTQGRSLGSVLLKDVMWVGPTVEATDGQHVWFAAKEHSTGKDILCRWEHAAAGADEAVRLSTRYTAETPDTEGLALCRQLADELEEKYYVEILMHTDLVEPSDYSFVPEYQVPAYRKALQALDTAMAKFPEGFFRIVASSSNSPKLYISLVRTIQPNRYDVPALPSGYQYWIDGSSYMALLVNDEVEQKFYHELSHVLDTYVRGKSVHYDYWKDCNPKEFQYDESYTDYEKYADSPYLKGENRAFINAFSMTFDYEDRATVMEYALLDGSEAVFASDIMQAKLKTLCQGIRRAFGWRHYEGTFLWEQYLKESLAYVKKK